jgi:hypothetical protein
MSVPFKRTSLQSCAVLLVIGLSACATTVSTSSYKGEAKDVAQTVKDLQSDVTANDQKKICKNDLSSAIVKSLSSAKGGCEQAIKDQLAEIASPELTIKSIQVGGTPAARTATVRAASKYSGKNRVTTLSLVKEDGKWKIAKLTA